ncbi:MAG: hypothetical protein JRL30_24150 [Deltaproteobacteria bacterium]|nr:hypothetical protein [Deltaproteobacteria bacterium]
MKRLCVISLMTMLFAVFSTPVVAEGERGGYDVWASVEEYAGPLMINGWAYVDAPLVNGLAAVHDLSGRELAWGESTDANGFFSIEVPGENFPEDMIVTVTGGIRGDQPFFGSIKIWLHQYGGGYFQVNSLTTLVAEYAQANPGMAYDRAVDDVRAFLEIPAEMPMQTQMNYCDLLDLSFSSELFFKEAVKYRGRLLEYDDFISSLIDEMSMEESHPFKGSTGTSITVFQMVDLFSGLMSGISMGLNWDMAKQFYGGDTTGWFVDMLMSGGDATGAQLAYIVNKLDALDAKLDVVIMSLGEISAELKRILDELKKLHARFDQSDAFKKELTLLRDRNVVANIYEKNGFIYEAKKLHKTLKKKTPDEWKKAIEKKKPDFEKKAEAIDSNVIDSGKNINRGLIERDLPGQEGYLDLLCTALETTVRNYGADPFLAYQYMEGKYAYYLRIFQQALQAYVEARHYLKSDPDSYEELRDEWVKGVTDKFLECVHRFVLNTNAGTITKEFSSGSESERILARAYALADRARSGLKKGDGTRYGLGDLSGQVLAYRGEYKSLGLTFKSADGSTVVNDKKQDVINDQPGLRRACIQLRPARCRHLHGRRRDHG